MKMFTETHQTSLYGTQYTVKIDNSYKKRNCNGIDKNQLSK